MHSAQDHFLSKSVVVNLPRRAPRVHSGPESTVHADLVRAMVSKTASIEKGVRSSVYSTSLKRERRYILRVRENMVAYADGSQLIVYNCITN